MGLSKYQNLIHNQWISSCNELYKPNIALLQLATWTSLRIWHSIFLRDENYWLYLEQKESCSIKQIILPGVRTLDLRVLQEWENSIIPPLLSSPLFSQRRVSFRALTMASRLVAGGRSKTLAQALNTTLAGRFLHPSISSSSSSRAASSCCDRSLSDPRSKPFAVDSHIKVFLSNWLINRIDAPLDSIVRSFPLVLSTVICNVH